MQTPTAAKLLGFAGLAPFFALALAAAGGDLQARPVALQGLLLYGGVILSFMGGCRWGFSAAGLGSGPDWAPLGLSVLPALLAWAALWGAPALGAQAAAAVLAAGFVALYLWDVAGARRGETPAWWPALRFPLTIGATAALVVGLAL
ncbi:MAG: DUF3429 domain-containing protein, partial [Pseudomonadota bacterium]